MNNPNHFRNSADPMQQCRKGTTMPVSLEKVEAQAPHLVSLYKGVGVSLDKLGIDPSRYRAAVIGTFDHSFSTEDGHNKLYSDGTMQRVADISFAAGLQFDDDGSVPVSLFDNRVTPLGEITLANCRGFLDQHSKHRFGGTSYVSALRWIIEEAGFGRVDLGSLGASSGGGGGFLKRKHAPAHSELAVKATAPYPTYAIFVTDGEPQDRHEDIIQLLTLMSQLPIFVQFIGVGHHKFQFLKVLDNLGSRLIDNANFFDAKSAPDQDTMITMMLKEFPEFYVNARKLGLLV